MDRKPYRVTSLVDAITRVAGRVVAPGDVINLTDVEAKWEKSRRLIEDVPADLPPAPPIEVRLPPATPRVTPHVPAGFTVAGEQVAAPTGKPARDPLDHDGDGRRGGSLPRAGGRRKGR